MERVLAVLDFGKVPWKKPLLVVVALLLVGWLAGTPPGLLGKADAVGYAVCHRIDLRSFHLGERTLPLCARCSGMYLGAVLGLAFQALAAGRKSGMPSLRMTIILGVFVLAFAFDGVNSYLHLFPGAPGLYEPSNLLRLLTGTGMGLAIAAFLFPAYNQTVWKDAPPGRALGSWKAELALVLLALGLDALVLTENSLILYPLALISAGGVLLILSMVYGMVFLMLLRLESRIASAAQLAFPMLGGFGLALLQIIALDAVRYLFTGTWDGFHLG